MNENINLVEILKDCPKGTKLYSPLVGEVELSYIKEDDTPVISVKAIETEMPPNFPSLTLTFYTGGQYSLSQNGECMLFPSKDQRDWSKLQVPIPDKALVWCWDDDDKFGRCLRFYDAKKGRAFSGIDGDRKGFIYDNFELYKGEYPEWAKEIQKKLED